MKPDFFTGRFSSSQFARAVGLVLAAAFLAGCPASPPAEQPVGPQASSSGKVIIRGSNTIGEELGPKLITDFKKDHASAEFDLQPKATGYGLAALRAGQCDIAAASRVAIRDELDEATSMGVELQDHMIGSYSVTLVVNPKNPVANLTKQQVKDIFTGTVTNWSAVGGPDAAIHIYIRDPVSGTYLGFQELAMDNKPYAHGNTLKTSYADIAQAVAQDDNGIGYCGSTLPKGASVKALSIGGVDPTPASVNAGKYPYARGLHLYTRKGSEKPETRDFVQYVLSTRGQDVLSETGFVPHP